MAKLGWIGSVALATGASAGAAAAQFGLGYGLGIISWTPEASTGPGTVDSVWLSSLAWTTWIAATATVIGVICADRRSQGEIGSAPPRPGPAGTDPAPPSILATSIWRALLAVAAAVGALLSVALVLVPARVAVRADTSTPELIAAGYAVVGILVGIVFAIFALSARAVAVNLIATASWVWVLAAASVVDAVGVGRDLGTAPLAEWPFSAGTYFRSTWSVPGALLMLGAAFAIGAAAAWSAVRRDDGHVGAALSGVVGPLLIAAAYTLTTPRLVGLNAPQVSSYLVAPYAPIAGIAGSVLLLALSARSGPMAVRHLRQRRAAAKTGETEPVRIPVSSVSKRPPRQPARPTTPPVAPPAPTVSASAPAPAQSQARKSDESTTSVGTAPVIAQPPPSDEDATLRIRPNQGKRSRR